MVPIYIYLYIYILYGSQKLNIQRLISSVLFDRISLNFVKSGRIIVLPESKVWWQSDKGNPLFSLCENGKNQVHLYIIVAWQAPLVLVLWKEFCRVFFFLSPLWPCQATNSLAGPFGFGALKRILLSVFSSSVSPVALSGH